MVSGETVKLCECGCGVAAPISKETRPNRWLVKGQPMQFIMGHWARTSANRGALSASWKGGKYLHGSGYVMVSSPNHPRANTGGYVLEHILIAEKSLGRYLPNKVDVHHFNEQKDDNRNVNLVICEDRAYHMLLHARSTALRRCGDANARQCWICKRWSRDIIIRKGRASVHRLCRNEYSRQHQTRESTS